MTRVYSESIPQPEEKDNVSCPLLQAVEEPEPLPVSEPLQLCVPEIPKPQTMEEPTLPSALPPNMPFHTMAADDEFVPGSMCKCVLQRVWHQHVIRC